MQHQNNFLKMSNSKRSILPIFVSSSTLHVIYPFKECTLCNCSHSVSGLKRAGHRLHSEMFFDTLKINCSVAAKDIFERAAQRQINLRIYTEGVVSIKIMFIENVVVVV